MEKTNSLATRTSHVPDQRAAVRTDLTVSAIVVNHNGGEQVRRCIETLCAQRTPLRSIFVVDNGSTDGSPELIRAKFPDVRVLEMGGNIGVSAARNEGIRQSSADLVLLIDDDVYVADDCIEKLREAYERERATVVCPRIRLLPQREIVQADGASAHFLGTMLLRHAYRPLEGLPSSAVEVGACPGACMLFDRASVVEAGGFDEVYFFYFEDLEFSIRLRALGHSFFCEPAAVVYHDRGEGTPGLSFRGQGEYPRRRAYLTLRHRLLTMLIHYRLRTLIVLAPVLAIYEFISFGMALVRGWVGEWFLAWAWLFRNAGTVRHRRVRVQPVRERRDRELLTGGPIPLAPGLVRSRVARFAVTTLSALFNGYWRLARHLID